jgi:hypothetical protein
LSLFSTVQPLYTRFPIIFGNCFLKVTIGYNPNPRHEHEHEHEHGGSPGTKIVQGWPKLWADFRARSGFSVKLLGQVSQFGPTLYKFRSAALAARADLRAAAPAALGRASPSGGALRAARGGQRLVAALRRLRGGAHRPRRRDGRAVRRGVRRRVACGHGDVDAGWGDDLVRRPPRQPPTNLLCICGRSQ